VTEAQERRALRRIDRGILDLRILLVTGRVGGERRQLLEQELQTLRLARQGIHAPGQREVLARVGVTASGAAPRIRRESGDDLRYACHPRPRPPRDVAPLSSPAMIGHASI
jgi:hypothetical protein